MHFILDEKGEVKKEPSLMKWAEWVGVEGNRRIAHTDVGEKYVVSTIFLGLDYSFSGSNGKPILFETMVFDREPSEVTIFGGKKSMIKKSLDIDGMFERYTTKELAVAGHKEIVQKVESYIKK
jgi:hypothetical protein